MSLSSAFMSVDTAVYTDSALHKIYRAVLLRRIETADVVSFDIFDTLFVRPLADPEDAFDILGERFHIPDFRRIRRQAQTEAFRRMTLAGQNEITLEGIYACLTGLPDGVEATALCQAELELELALTQPNPDLINVFKETVARKRVVAVSDMYLPRSFFDTLFEKYELPRVPMYISSECDMTKRDRGELYDRLIADMGVPAGKVLHIGDNPVSDVARARERGLQAVHYVTALAVPYEVSRSVGASLVASLSKLNPNRDVINTFQGLGYRFGGPAALGLLEWVSVQAARDAVDRILFIACDGYILEQLAQHGHVPNLPPHSYFPGSRVAFALSAINDINFDGWVDFLMGGANGLSPDEVLQRIGVTAPEPRVMENLGLGRQIIINAANIKRVRDFLSAYRGEIIRTAIRNRRGLFNLLKAHGVKPGMRVAMVDVGWQGTTQETLHQALAQMLDVNLVGYYLALTDSADCRRRRNEMPMRALLDYQSIDAVRMDELYAHRVGVELMFSAPHEAVIGYELERGGKVSAIEDAGRNSDVSPRLAAVNQIQRGILDFADDYEALCQNLQYRAPAHELAQALLDFVHLPPAYYNILNTLKNFDAWGSSRNFNQTMNSYR
jgi:predicted HAD superfamily hydrolase